MQVIKQDYKRGEWVPAFGEWVREQRSKQRLTEAECAQRAGMKRQNWYRLEKTAGRPQLGTVEAVARALEIPLEYAMSAAGYPTFPNADEASVRLAHRLNRILEELPDSDRSKVEELLEKDASHYVALLKPYLNRVDNIEPKLISPPPAMNMNSNH